MVLSSVVVSPSLNNVAACLPYPVSATTYLLVGKHDAS